MFFCAEILAQPHPSTTTPWSFVNKKRLWQTVAGSALWIASNGAAAGGWVGWVGAPKWGNKMPIKIGQFQKTRIQRSLRQVILRHTQIISNTEIGEEFDMHLDYWVGSESKLHKSLSFLVSARNCIFFQPGYLLFSTIQPAEVQGQQLEMWASQARDGGNISCECGLVSTPEAGMTSRSMPSRQLPLKTFCLMAHVCCDVFSMESLCFEPC